MKLIFITAEFAGQTCELRPGKTSIGRSESSGLVIQHPSISADHCEILVHGPEVIFREHGSSNGTWIDNQRVGAQLPARNGQVIRLGAVEARLEVPPAAPEDSISVTAVHLHAQAMAELSQPKSASEPTRTVIKPNHGSASDVDKTVAFKASDLGSSAAPSRSPAPEPARRMNLTTVVAVVVILAAIIAIWLLLKQR